MRSTLARRTTLTLGLIYVAFGIAEVIAHRTDTVAALLFWGVSLLGGGGLVLSGVLTWSAHPRSSTALVVIGAALGMTATAWTVLIPLLAIVVIVLAVREHGTLAGGGPAQQRREAGPTTRSGGQEGNAST